MRANFLTLRCWIPASKLQWGLSLSMPGCVRRRIWVSSDEHLNVQFNPAALLSLGDARAFAAGAARTRSCRARPRRTRGGARRPRQCPPPAKPGAAGGRAADAGADGAARPITSRVPQKYLIQNQSGLAVYYWVDVVRARTQGASSSIFYGACAC